MAVEDLPILHQAGGLPGERTLRPGISPQFRDPERRVAFDLRPDRPDLAGHLAMPRSRLESIDQGQE
jgi:hypothetical protein